MSEMAFQDYYDDAVSHCYGCGRLNEHGLQIKSRWEGDEAVCRYTPRPYHTAIPGYVYGGLIASLVDCHATGTAAAASYRAEGREMGTEPVLRFVTASLRVDFLRPTPIDAEIELRAFATEVSERKVKVAVTVLAAGEQTARGEVVTVRMPDSWVEEAPASS
ncbi:MAG: PaaI family thioesterase [Anaerolineae bacterium]